MLNRIGKVKPENWSMNILFKTSKNVMAYVNMECHFVWSLHIYFIALNKNSYLADFPVPKRFLTLE